MALLCRLLIKQIYRIIVVKLNKKKRNIYIWKYEDINTTSTRRKSQKWINDGLICTEIIKNLRRAPNKFDLKASDLV